LDWYTVEKEGERKGQPGASTNGGKRDEERRKNSLVKHVQEINSDSLPSIRSFAGIPRDSFSS